MRYVSSMLRRSGRLDDISSSETSRDVAVKGLPDDFFVDDSRGIRAEAVDLTCACGQIYKTLHIVLRSNIDMSTMASDIEITAAQRALGIPEILSAILRWIYRDDYSWWISAPNEDGTLGHLHNSRGVLLRCGLINTLWNKESMRYLWKEPRTLGFRKSSLPVFFAKIEPSRRQLYAN